MVALLSGLGAGCGGKENSSSSSAGDDQFASDLTAAHNRVRANVVQPANYPGVWVPLPPLLWSNDVAASAQAWADSLRDQAACNPLVDGSSSYGENVAGGTIGYTALDAFGAWAADRQNYVYTPTYTFSEAIGNYTQIVWRDTTELGCAWAQCATGYLVYVCRYRPAGNVVGMQPY